ncbi:MAG TPA: hypothetical protein VMZ50_06580, partial [Phycisphaerae bacterium]|nr:hypothetical protein [Phycisphaerae bacterium]
MNTHYGWYSSGIFPGGNHYWNLEFWDAVFQEEILRVGEAHFDSKMDRYSAAGTGRWVFFSSTLFGDPETRFYAPLDGGARILAHRPSGELPAGQSRIILEFSEPMDLAGFSVADDVVSFTGPGGADLRNQISGFAWLDPFTLEIDFQPQSRDGGYELVLGPQITDAGGEPLDQDNDGNSGETSDDRYVAAFTLESPPGVVEVVRNDGVGPPSTLTSLAFAFSEDVSSSIDVGDLTLFNDTAGAAVDMSQAAVSYDSGTNAARWDLTGLCLGAGYYTATLSAGGIMDVAGNGLDGDGDGAGGDDYSLSVLVAQRGDADLDGDVDLDDLTIVGTYYGTETGATWAMSDFDGDGDV